MTDELAARVRAGDRRALAQAITLVESTRDDHREQAAALLDQLLPHTGGSSRVAVTGSPGSGKSTFIEALGVHLTGRGARVAVLAIDPTSQRSGGSILGDKTRMDELAKHAEAFIRPSPSGSTLGGVARRTREALLVCEAAGFDVVLVETVGVGQSETAAADLVDCVLLLAAPGGGDELQGMKRGIMELADVIVVNKADRDLLPAARRAAADLGHAVHLLRPRYPGWQVPVLLASAQRREGIEEAWEAVTGMLGHLDATAQRATLRSEQALGWMWDEIREGLVERFYASPEVAATVESYVEEVRRGARSPGSAARSLLDLRLPL